MRAKINALRGMGGEKRKRKEGDWGCWSGEEEEEEEKGVKGGSLAPLKNA